MNVTSAKGNGFYSITLLYFYSTILLSAKNRLPARKSFMRHTCWRLCRKGACLSGACTKRYADPTRMPTYTERRTHVHRTPYVRTPNGVRMHTVRRTCPSER